MAPVCPHCGVIGNATAMNGATTRPGLYKCKTKECRKPFTVTMGTVMERSHIRLHKWVLAAHFMASSKKGMSALQLQRMLGVTYETAWFLFHRLRECPKDAKRGPMGGNGKVIEADEAYIGGKDANRHADKRLGRKLAFGTKFPVLTLIERDGEARSFHMANVTGRNVRGAIVRNASRKSHLMTDSARIYPAIGAEFAGHSIVNHEAGEYAREAFHHSNSAESYFAILKRGVYGTFHSVSEAHLHRYLVEFDFRWSTRSALGVDDVTRAEILLKGAAGKRLYYRQPAQATHA